MKETIDTYCPTQKDRYVHKIIPIISLQIIAKKSKLQHQYTLSPTVI